MQFNPIQKPTNHNNADNDSNNNDNDNNNNNDNNNTSKNVDYSNQPAIDRMNSTAPGAPFWNLARQRLQKLHFETFSASRDRDAAVAHQIVEIEWCTVITGI